MPYIMTGHAYAAMLLGPEMHISEVDALALARCWVSWRQHYPALIQDAKWSTLLALMGMAALIEVPRLSRVAERKKRERGGAAVAKAAARQTGLPNVVPMAGI